MDVYGRLTKVFREVFGDPGLEVDAETTAADIDGWDSLSHINLVLAVEEEFRVRFDAREVLSFRNVGDMAASLEKKSR